LVFDVEGRPGHSSTSTSSWPSMYRLCHSKTRMHNITLSLYTSFNSWNILEFFFQFNKKFLIDALLDFHSSHKSGRATQHGHIQTKLRDKPTDIERKVQSCLIWES
jgi:hypothetical protein